LKIRVRNTEYYEWEVPDEIIEEYNKGITEQELIDNYFSPDDLSVADIGDPYYEHYE